jgi:ABC-type glycerol-3-phosphate transport system substrate-binding protein
MKRIFALLLAITMLAASVASCGAKTDTPADTTTAPTADTTTAPTDTATTAPAETLPPELQDTLPDVRYEGETFTALLRESTKYEMQSEEITGDLLSDAVYQRNLDIEERFGVKVKTLTEPGAWGDRENFIARVSNSVLGGDHEFDMVLTHNSYMNTMPIKGLAYDLATLENLDFSKKWWHSGYMDNAEINGAIYTAAGDIGVTVYEYLEVVFFNKKIAEENQITDLYEVVQSGAWTYDKMMEYVSTVTSDLNGDGKYDINDLFGLSIDAHNLRYLPTYWEADITVVGSDGLRDFNLPNEKYIDAYDKAYAMVYNYDQVFYAGDSEHDDTAMFTKDQLLFHTERLGNAKFMREMESEYGIIPFPKYNTEQENYISVIDDPFSGLMVVNSIQNPEMVGTMIEALCMYGYHDITPAYYETTLKLKYLSDETAMNMIDLVRDSVVLDFAMIYSTLLSQMYSYISNSVHGNIASITSGIKAQSKVWQKTLDKFYADYEKIAQ